MLKNHKYIFRNIPDMKIQLLSFPVGSVTIFLMNDKINGGSMTHSKSLAELEQSGAYGSVVISNCGCRISSILSAQHFSFRHAPALPLKGCTANKCTCEYQGIIDHRIGDRRIHERCEKLSARG